MSGSWLNHNTSHFQTTLCSRQYEKDVRYWPQKNWSPDHQNTNIEVDNIIRDSKFYCITKVYVKWQQKFVQCQWWWLQSSQFAPICPELAWEPAYSPKPANINQEVSTQHWLAGGWNTLKNCPFSRCCSAWRYFMISGSELSSPTMQGPVSSLIWVVTRIYGIVLLLQPSSLN